MPAVVGSRRHGAGQKIAPRCRGFTLLEVLIAVLLLAGGVLGVARLQHQALVASGDLLDRTLALALARGVLDAARAGTGGAPAALAWARDEVATLLPDGEVELAERGGLVEVTVRWASPGDQDPAGGQVVLGAGP